MAARLQRESMYRHQEQQRAADYRKTQTQIQQAALTNHINYINSLPTDPESVKIRLQGAVEVSQVFIPISLISLATLLPVLVIGLARGSGRTMLRASASSGGINGLAELLFLVPCLLG